MMDTRADGIYVKSELTIAGGAITVTESHHKVDTAGDAVFVGYHPIPKGKKRCEACGRFVNGNVFIIHTTRPNAYVCNVACGIKVAEVQEQDYYKEEKCVTKKLTKLLRN